ncbi:MAG: hypothetical protein ACYTEQ_07525 [Planctomycetota bacterium]|jgi:hypothetical protein
MKTAEHDLTEEHGPGQKESPTANLAKKAIDTIRNSLFAGRNPPTCQSCGQKHRPSHPCAESEKGAKPETLTQKAIQSICGIVPTGKPAPNPNPRTEKLRTAQAFVETPTQPELAVEETTGACTDALQEMKSRLRAEEKARAEVQEQAKAETEARASLEAEAQEKAGAYAAQIARMQATIEAERKARIAAEQKARSFAMRVRSEAEIALRELKFAEIPSAAAQNAMCECCGREDVLKDRLARIDSGQMLCENCLTQLRQPRPHRGQNSLNRDC